jgi:hypothetical protein
VRRKSPKDYPLFLTTRAKECEASRSKNKLAALETWRLGRIFSKGVFLCLKRVGVLVVEIGRRAFVVIDGVRVCVKKNATKHSKMSPNTY